MHLITYISDLELSYESKIDQVLDDIVAVAKEENLKRQITGVLFFHNNKFMQVIEGARTDLEFLMYKITKDPRHFNIEYLINTPVESRGFADWNMDVFYLGVESDFNYFNMKKLTLACERNLITRSDQLVSFYKTLLEEVEACA